MLQAARDLHKLGPKYVLIKGGHLITPPPSNLTTPSPLPPGPHTSGPPPSDPTTPSPAALNPCTDAASSPSSSAPQTSLEAASSTQDPATQSSESLLASASDDISQPADVSMSDTHGQGGSAAINGHRDTDTDAHTGASEQTTRKSEGKQDKLVSLHRNTSCRMTKHQTSCALYNAVLQAHMKALLCWVQYSHERFPFGSRELEGGGEGREGEGNACMSHRMGLNILDVCTTLFVMFTTAASSVEITHLIGASCLAGRLVSTKSGLSQAVWVCIQGLETIKQRQRQLLPVAMQQRSMRAMLPPLMCCLMARRCMCWSRSGCTPTTHTAQARLACFASDCSRTPSKL